MDSRNSDSRRSSGSSSSGVKSKWIKAFRSLKLTTVGSNRSDVVDREQHNAMRINAQLGVHAFQEYTYKKITACDVCREILRGHSRQGLKCKLCKMNVHSGSCQESAPKCQPKPRLLRKQKSASELETKIAIPQIEDEKTQNYDPVYQSLRAAAEARKCAQYMREREHYLRDQRDHDAHDEELENSSGTLEQIRQSSFEEPVYPERSMHCNGSVHGINHHDLNGPAQTQPPLSPLPPSISAPSSHRNSNEYPHYPSSSMLQGPPHIRYPNHPYPALGNGNSHPEAMRSHIKQNTPALLTITQTSHQAYSAPHSPQKKKLTLRMKSLSLDSPESAETLSREKRPTLTPAGNVSHTPPSYDPVDPVPYTKYKAPQQTHSPSMSKRFKLGMHGRMCSFESDPMGDLSTSLSPCPSPKPQRLLPTNIFVVLYNFRSRQVDELNLRAGYMVTVVDTTDPEWWQGKCMGKVGFFPSKYVTKLFPGERPLQVIHTVQVNDGEFATKLLREQIVIQVSEEMNGIIMVRTGTNDKIVACPSKYLQEITI